MSITKQAYDVARKSITEHGNRMKQRFQDFFVCEQYWIDTADAKCGGKDVAAWEAAAITDSGENQSAFRLYARCGFILDCVKEASTLDSKAIQAFGRLVEFSTKNGFSWKNATDKESVKAFALGDGAKDQEAAKEESLRLQPNPEGSKGKSKENAPPPVQMETITPENISDSRLAGILSGVPMETLEKSFGIIAKPRLSAFLRSLVRVMGEDDVCEVINAEVTASDAATAPMIDVPTIESQLQPA